MKKIILVLVALILCIPMPAYAKKGGNPDNLQQQIDELKLRVEALEQAPTGSIGVYDANGQYLCQYTGENGSTAIFCFIESIGGFAGIEYPTGNYAGRTDDLWFESGDCTGQPYVLSRNRNKIVKLNTTHPNSYFQILGAETISILMNSYFDDDECRPLTEQKNVLPVEEVTLPFRLPVAMPLRFGN